MKYSISTPKIIISIFVLSFFYISGFSQQWMWANNLTGTDDIKINSLTFDVASNTLIAVADIKGNVNIGSQNFTSFGSDDILLIKYNMNGDLIWAKQYGSAGKDVPKRVVLDVNGDIYVIGSFSDGAQFGGITLNSYDGEDIFITKVSSDGNILWARNIGWGPNLQRGTNLIVKNSGNIFVTAFYNDSIMFDHDTLIANGVTNNFIAEFDNSGNFLNTILDVKGTSKYTRLNSVSFSNDEGLLITGHFVDSLFFPNDTLNSIGSYDIVFFKINSFGKVDWIRHSGSPANDRLKNSYTDIHGNIYAIGYIGGYTLVDSSGTNLYDAIPLTAKGGSDIFLAKYNSSGRLIWKKAIGGDGIDLGYDISIDQNLIHFTGNVAGIVVFNNDTINTGSSTVQDAFFGIYDLNGNPIAAHNAHGSSNDLSQSIAYTGSGEEIIGGYYTSPTLSFDSFMLTNSGGKDGFVAKYSIPFKITITDKQDVTCNGGSNGSATVTPYFGTYPYTYTWSYDDGTADSTLSGVPAGDYWVTVTDAHNKKDSVAFTITQPDSISVTATVTDVSCPGGNNGAIDITVKGGTSPYVYQWNTSNGSGVDQTAEDQSGLTAGDYNLRITDDHGCTMDTAFAVQQPDPITFGGSSVTDIVHPPGNNGAIDLSVHGGTPSYTFYWEGPGFTATTEDISGLDNGGDYKVTVTDSKSCKNDTTFLVQDNTALIATIDSVKDVTCYGESDGYAHVTVTGGTGPYEYKWTNSGGTQVGGDSPSLPDVPAGTYYVTVTDQSDSRTASTSATIKDPDQALTITLSNEKDITCNGMNDGEIDITVQGGRTPYTFSWTGPNGFTANTEDIADLGPGNYYITVTDAGGCEVQKLDIPAIQEPAVLTVDIQINKGILCYGDLTGELEALPTGGTPAYAYQWDDPGSQTTKKATYLEAGTYTVTVTDGNGCTTKATESLSQPDPLSMSAIIKDVSCAGQQDGSIILTPSGGTVPYSYLWKPDNQVSKDLTDVPAGDYTVTLTDNHNCSIDSSFTVSEPPALLIDSVSVTNISGCPGNTNGALVIYASGAVPPYEYSSDGGTTWQTDSIFTGLGAGDYPIAVRDAHSCSVTGSTVTLTDPDGVIINDVVTTPITCPGGSDGTLAIQATGGLHPYEFSIDGGNTFQADSIFSGLQAGDYNVAVRDQNGCLTQGNMVTLTDPEGVTIDNVTPTPISCPGEADGTLTILASGGTQPYDYSVDGGTAWQEDSLFTGLSKGNYDIAVRDSNGCVTQGSTVALSDPDPITLGEPVIDPTCPGDHEGAITVTATGGTGTLTFLLLNDEGAPLDSSKNTASFTHLDIGTYTISVDDENHCGPETTTAEVPQADNCGLIIYDAFSPNGDGKNEHWTIRGIQSYPNCVVKVFNTWGNQVFSSKGYTEPWDGTFNGKALPAGTYYYIIDLGDGGKTYSGTVNIVK